MPFEYAWHTGTQQMETMTHKTEFSKHKDPAELTVVSPVIRTKRQFVEWNRTLLRPIAMGLSLSPTSTLVREHSTAWLGHGIAQGPPTPLPEFILRHSFSPESLHPESLLTQKKTTRQ